MEKLKMQTADMAEKNIEILGQLFPNCLTEKKNDKGKLVRAIDFDKLRQELACEVVEGAEERYQFTWPDKRNAIRLANAPINKTLRPCREESVDFDNTENLYIEGDNLEVLKLLRENYLGKVKMIYIDPPYNTGNDFVYNDDFAQSQAEFNAQSGLFDEDGNRMADPMVQNTESNGRFHTDWLNMIYPRLKVAKDLLADDGVIFISIDDNEVRNLRNICDEVFGEENQVAEIPWQSRASIQNDTDFSINHEYICVYAKRRRLENRRLKESNITEWFKKDSFVCRPLPLDKSKFDNPDNDPRGLWKADPFDAPNIRPNLTYVITNPLTGEQFLPPHGRHWRTESAQFQKALNDNRIVFGKDGKGRPQLKVFYEEKKEFGSIDNSWFSADRIGTTTNGTKEVMSLFDGYKYFDMPKPTSMIRKIIELGNVKSDDIILDFFSGSATTAHAVMQLNAEDGGNRRFIMVQLPEITYTGKKEKFKDNEGKEQSRYVIDQTTGYPIIEKDSEARKAGYWTIPQIGKERIRRAGKKIKEEVGLMGQNLDTGFRVLKLDESNMADVYYTPAETPIQQTLALDVLVNNIRKGRTPEDLLFQVMPECNLPLSSKIEEREMHGKKVFVVNDGYLIACFDTDINEAVITAIAKEKPYYFVMRDSSMATDNVAANFDQIFNAYSKETIRRIL